MGAAVGDSRPEVGADIRQPGDDLVTAGGGTRSTTLWGSGSLNESPRGTSSGTAVFDSYSRITDSYIYVYLMISVYNESLICDCDGGEILRPQHFVVVCELTSIHDDILSRRPPFYF